MLLKTSLLIVAASSLLATESWQSLFFDNVPTGQVVFSDRGILIEVKNSATPMVQKLNNSRKITRVEVIGKISGSLNIPNEKLWAEGFDDAFLRFGLIEAGTTRLTPFQRLSASSWVKEIDGLFASSGGISKIHSLQLMNSESWIGKERENPANPLFQETISAVPEADGSFRMTAEFDVPLETVGIWILADGDDTHSSFDVKIEEINLIAADDE